MKNRREIEDIIHQNFIPEQLKDQMRRDGTFFDGSTLTRMAHEHSLAGVFRDNLLEGKSSARQLDPLYSTVAAEGGPTAKPFQSATK